MEPLSAPAAEALAAAWLAAHPDGLSASLHAPDGGAALASLPMHAGTNLRFSDRGYRLNVGFKQPISAASTLAEAQDAFAWVALDRVPLPDFQPPAAWDIYPQTPVSSFSEGVTVTAYSGSRIKLHVKSSFFCIYGRRNDVQVPACAPSPEGTYFQIRQPIPMELQLDLPLAWAAAATP